MVVLPAFRACDAAAVVYVVVVHVRTSSSFREGNEVFLKGQYIELGIHSVASFGTRYVWWSQRARVLALRGV